MNVGLKKRLVTHRAIQARAAPEWIEALQAPMDFAPIKRPLTRRGMICFKASRKDHLFRLGKVPAFALEVSAHFAGAFVSPG